MNRISRIPRIWRILAGVLIACILLGTSAAFAGGILKISIGSGISIGGTIHVVAPDPTVDDIVVQSISTPDVLVGSTAPLTITISIRNDSEWTLYLQSGTFDIDAGVGSLAISDTTMTMSSILPGRGVHSVDVILAPADALAIGDYSWSGELSYSW